MNRTATATTSGHADGRGRRNQATLVGLGAIGLWATLALLTALSGAMPPFQLAAVTFAVGTLVGLSAGPLTGARLSDLRQPLPVWMVGVGGLFGYHFVYFTALRHAPPVEASLIAYLWPLLIVLGSALMPGERLRWHHVAGAALGFCGAALIVSGRLAGGPGLDGLTWGGHGFGYAMAFLCALLWAAYSLASRRFPAVPSFTVTGFCAATALLSALCHLALETTVWPDGAGQWLAILALGLGPVGAAFYVWDHGVKHGDIQVLGAASYLAPLLSTLALLAAGLAVADLRLGIATALIAGGAALAARDLIAGALRR